MSKLSDEETLMLLLEAARRANWDAQFGPPHLRSGRFFIWPSDGRETNASQAAQGESAEASSDPARS